MPFWIKSSISSIFRLAFFAFGSFLFLSCSQKVKKADLIQLHEHKEFEQAIQVKKFPTEKKVEVREEPEDEAKEEVKEEVKRKPIVRPRAVSSRRDRSVQREKKEAEVEEENVEAPKVEPKRQLAKHLPEIEDGEGFDGRRPINDPFVVGEEVVLDASYGIVSAGDVILRVNPFLEVNNEKAYHFSAHVKTNSVFSFFYEVDDWAETYVRYEDLLPFSYSVHVRETKQFREVRSFFDWSKLEAKYWEKKLKRGKMREKRKEWKILPFSQNVVSAFFYLRAFEYKAGKEMAFRVADDGKNFIVRMKVEKRETLSTHIGKLDTFVSRLNFEYEGVFKPVGDVLVWTTNDERKQIVRIEAKIKIGTIVLAVKDIRRL